MFFLFVCLLLQVLETHLDVSAMFLGLAINNNIKNNFLRRIQFQDLEFKNGFGAFSFTPEHLKRISISQNSYNKMGA